MTIPFDKMMIMLIFALKDLKVDMSLHSHMTLNKGQSLFARTA